LAQKYWVLESNLSGAHVRDGLATSPGCPAVILVLLAFQFWVVTGYYSSTLVTGCHRVWFVPLPYQAVVAMAKKGKKKALDPEARIPDC
jgi:hypothetical protein